MEAAGLAVGILALYALCKDGYGFCSNFHEASESAGALQRQLAIQLCVLNSWGAYWEIESEIPHNGGEASVEAKTDSASPKKIETYLEDKPYKAYGVAVALYSLGKLLTTDKLLDRYGIQLNLVSKTLTGPVS